MALPLLEEIGIYRTTLASPPMIMSLIRQMVSEELSRANNGIRLYLLQLLSNGLLHLRQSLFGFFPQQFHL